MHHPSISAGGDDIDKLSGDIAQINKDIGEADLKANSNDPDERAFWRKRVESLQKRQAHVAKFHDKGSGFEDRTRTKGSEADRSHVRTRTTESEQD